MMRITVLAENTAISDSFAAEHGLSLYLEGCGRKILFDMGQTDVFARNAQLLGIDLSEVDFAVLSHGHYDHGGGLSKFLEINSKAPVYLSRHAFGDHYSTKYIGLDKSLASDGRLRYVDEYMKIEEGAELFSCNDIPLKYPSEPFGLTAEHDGVRADDDFRHEQYLLLNENGKRILISGCSHKSVLNLADHFHPDVIVGGFHFMKIDAETEEGKKRLAAAARELNESGAEFYTCHCTGEEQYRYLKSEMSRLQYISCGSVHYV